MKRFLFFMIAPLCAMAIAYDVNFVGIKDQAALKSMFDVSDLVILQDRPPASINGLRYRISSDIPALLKVLRAYGYYDAVISSEIDQNEKGIQVFLLIHPGEQYKLSSYDVYHADCTKIAEIENCCPFTPESLGLNIGKPAISFDIVNAELSLLTQLARCGYPLATVEKRKVVVDMAEKEVKAASCIEEGPLSKFGPLTIFGLKTVEPRYLLRRVAWDEGEIYNTDSVEATQKRLLNSDLFSSVLISHEETLDEQGELPIKMRITEAKHRQLSMGVYYATVDGPGVALKWTHRNVRGMGEIVTLDADFSKRYIAGKLTYKKPDFIVLDQSYRAFLELDREDIFPYTAFSYRFANYIERKFQKDRSYSIGLKVEHINVSESASNGTYLLVGLPLFGKYDASDNVLDPTTGYTLVYQLTPYQSLDHGNQHFVKQRFTGTFYIPMGTKNFVLAGRVQAGSIAGTKQKHVPLTKLFIGGSEDDLRGYRYMSVSPLKNHHDPLGGRSSLYLTVETRMRFGKKIGVVPFADFGTVTFSELPTVDAKWFKSVGIGLRYFSFFGPLRVDVGFPLDRRKGVDHWYQIYASIGQTF